VRFQNGKTAEIFVLVCKGTNEEQWFNRASQGIEYQTITEQQLDIVLEKGYIDTLMKEDFVSNYRF
jgi:hypothetical protein